MKRTQFFSSRYRLVLIVALLCVVASCFGRSEAGDEIRLRAMRAEIDALIDVPRCRGAGDCATVAIGSKPCGGPSGYLVYSPGSVIEAKLALKIARYNALEDQMNHRYGRVSDCSVVPRPQVDCLEGVCRPVLASPNPWPEAPDRTGLAPS